MVAYNAETATGWVAVIQPEGGEPRAFKGEMTRTTSQRWAQRIAARQECPVIEGRGSPWLLSGTVLDYGEPVPVLRIGQIFAWDDAERGMRE